MNAPRFLPVVATLIVAGTAAANGSPGSAGTDSAINLLPGNNLRGSSRHLQGGTDEIAPLLTVSGGLSKCQGDCDSDEDCTAGLVCWYDWDGSGKVPGCAGTPQPDSEYCIDPNDMNTCVPPGGICELDEMGNPISICCSPDNECVDSRCVTTDPPTDMPTGTPTGTSTGSPTGTPTSMPTAIPSAPAATALEIVVEEDSIEPTSNSTGSSLIERPPLAICMGDCDWDEDCEEGLVCWYEDGSGEVPGCSGTPRAGWEYCIDPKASDGVETDSITANQSNYTGLSLTEADYISKCEGDCDYDEDCSDGLVCWYDDDETGDIPGCTGTPREGWEYCIDPNMIFKNATHVEWLDDYADDLGSGEYGRCQGDCDYDIDCEGVLVCFYPTEEIRIVPGCKGPPTPDWEYCADPKDIEEHAKQFESVNLNSTDDSQ